MPVDEDTLSALVDAARLSTPQLESIAQGVLGASISQISSVSTPAGQARDMVTYAKQYGLLRQLAAAIIYTGADRAGLQNLLFGDENMVSQTEDQRNNAANSFEIVRLENRVERLSDRLIVLEHRVDAFLQRTPLNWNIVALGIAIAIMAGFFIWLATVTTVR